MRSRSPINSLKQYLFLATFITALMLPVSGCSVFMAAQQPAAKNVELFKVGTPRDELIAEFGPPYISEETEGKKVEIFLFIQGYSKATKTGRVIFHTAADVFTLGLWEIIGTPTELYFDGNEMAFHVSYDEHDRIDAVNALRKK
ncbi:hypothetical protein [Nitrosomonas sp.]|uniref:hypothetical protein n=1 Tax=Nitrosomonas sp. TaxID=42353 RepID=UPI0025E534DF|nr:hypothetical protein [Nitrosomonas sp.]